MIGEENANVFIDVDGETTEKVNSFRYLEASKTNTDSFPDDINENKYRTSKESCHVTGNHVER